MRGRRTRRNAQGPFDPSASASASKGAALAIIAGMNEGDLHNTLSHHMTHAVGAPCQRHEA